jgi:hypothetical protein
MMNDEGVFSMNVPVYRPYVSKIRSDVTRDSLHLGVLRTVGT